MRKKIILFSMLLLLFFNVATELSHAHHVTGRFEGEQKSSTSGWIPMYGANGGFLLSIRIDVSSSVTYRRSSLSGYDEGFIHGTASTPHGPASQCGGILSVSSPAKLSGANVTMVQGGTYLSDPRIWEEHRHSGLVGLGIRPYSHRVEVSGAFYPSTCAGGRTITNSWTLSVR